MLENKKMLKEKKKIRTSQRDTEANLKEHPLAKPGKFEQQNNHMVLGFVLGGGFFVLTLLM